MKLDGIRVLDLSRFLPGPMLTQLMADHGAEVIKVESTDEGEPTRAVGEMRDGVSVFFANTNRGKKSIALNLKRPEAVEVLMRLAETADVFVEAFRPGVAARLGIDYPRVAARAPRIIYASISAFGQTGPYRDVATHDIATQAMAGVLSITRGRDGAPAIPGLAAGDMLAAAMALSGVLMALLRRKDTGHGDCLDIAMADCLVAALPNQFGPAMASRQPTDVRSGRSLGGNALYALYETQDDEWVALGGQEMKFAVTVLTLLGRPDLIELCRLPPGRGQNAVRAFLKATFLTRSRKEWEGFFRGHDVPFAPVQSLPEVLDDANFRARGMVVVDARGWDHLGNPIKFAAEPAAERLDLAARGQHSHELLARLGYSAEAITRLEQDGALRQASTKDIGLYSPGDAPMEETRAR